MDPVVRNDIEELDFNNRDIMRAVTNVPLFSSEMLTEIVSFDCTVEIVGYVESIEASKRVRSNSLTVFKFVLSNGVDSIQITAWNDEVERAESIIRPNLIVHIDGASAKSAKVGQYNKGSVNVELTIQSNTIINILGKRSIAKAIVSPEMPEKTTIERVGHSLKYSQIEGFVKTTLKEVKRYDVEGPGYGCGSITDGTFKLEIRVLNFENNLTFFDKGTHIRVNGRIDGNANPIYFAINSLDDITLIDNEKMAFKDLIRGRRSISKHIMEDENEQNAAKKSKN